MCATKTTSAQTLWQPSKTILTILLFVSLNSDFATLSCSARVHQQHELSVGKEQQCQSHNQRLSNFLRDRLDEVDEHAIPRSGGKQDLESFVREVKEALDTHMLSQRAINHLFSRDADFHPSCSGLWMEFGVASGTTVNLAAKFRQEHCSETCPPVIGFDTFTGLPEDWNRDDLSGGTWKAHTFARSSFPKVEPNVHLVKGLFNETLPAYLGNLSIYAGSDYPVSYLHIDCDLYVGARDALDILSPHIKVGTVIILDELQNYQHYRQHEIKALWEYLVKSGTHLLPIGMYGPLTGKEYAMELDIQGAAAWEAQSSAWVVAYQSPPSVA